MKKQEKNEQQLASPVTPPPARPVKKRSSNVGKVVSLVFLMMVLAVFGGAFGSWMVLNSDLAGSLQSGVVSRDSGNDGNKLVLKDEESIAKVAQDVSPSVVSISTSNATRRGIAQGAGTGVIVSKDGYVMTNKHVVSGANGAKVTTSDGEMYDNVKIIGSDPLNDVAFLKIENASNLKPAKLGESSTLRIGQSVVAIGNSLGEYENTVTSGIVSGLGRPVAAQSQDGTQAESLTDLIQTDAAINPGNSGGPLVNLTGQVVGLNTAVVDNAQGIGFAIPINAVKGILKGVLEDGEVKRAYLGVRYVDITPALAKEQKLPVKRGGLVSSGSNSPAVEAGGPADKAGIEDGDIIIKVGDLTVGEQGNVSSLISEYTAGSTIEVTILRDGKEQTKKVTLATYEADEAETSSVEERPQERRSSPNMWPFSF